jgi:heterodisulfide reductase subunit A-like polyferredoxin
MGARTLVVGAGLAGMRAALDLADIGVEVVLVERSAATGGSLTQLDVQYPTVDCGACQMHESLTGPPWSERRCLRTGVSHPLIRVLTSTTVSSVEPDGEGFIVSLRTSSEVAGAGPATPREPNVNVAAGPAPAADAADAGITALTEHFGAIILATGFAGFDPKLQPQWAYRRHADVVTALELERMVAPSPHGGFRPPRRPSTGEPARRVAFVQCVGSRDEERPYCSAICCMHALKEAILLRERLGVETCDIYAIDMRCVGKGTEQTLARALASGVRIVHGRPGAVEPGDRPVLRVDTGTGPVREPYDLVVLSVGLVPPPGTTELACILGVDLDEHGFVRTRAPGLVGTSRTGVFVCGALAGPADIPWSTTSASAAALATAGYAGAFAGEGPFWRKGHPPDPHPQRLSTVFSFNSSGVAQMGYLEVGDLSPRLDPVPVRQRALVLGAGPAGMSAALAISRAGFPVTLLERADEAGGMLRRLRRLLDGSDPARLLRDLRESIAADRRIERLFGSELVSHQGGPGAYVGVIRDLKNGTERAVEHGAFVVATGAIELEPVGCFGYGENPAVMTQLELEERLAVGRALPGDPAPTVVMIQCVGSREPGRPVCSRICCSEAVKNALTVTERYPEARVIILHRDIRTIGLAETRYEEARRRGVVQIRITDGEPPSVEPAPDGALVRFRDPILGQTVRVRADLVVLSAALVPSLAATEVAALGLHAVPGGFVAEANVKFRTVEASRRGVLVAGTALAPVTLAEAMTQAAAAATRAVALLSRSHVERRPGAVAFRPARCAACGLCVDACPAGARELRPEREARAIIHPGLCLGCGACAAACPSGCTEQPELEARKVLTMLEDALEGEP